MIIMPGSKNEVETKSEIILYAPEMENDELIEWSEESFTPAEELVYTSGMNESNDTAESNDASDSVIYQSNDRSGITYEVVKKASVRGQDKLLSSDGYSYTVKTLGQHDKIIWRCTYRKEKDCAAKIFQDRDNYFTPTGPPHMHPPDPDQNNYMRVYQTMKVWAIKYRSETSTSVAKKILSKFMPGAPAPESGLMSVNALSTKIKYIRRRTPHTKSKDAIKLKIKKRSAKQSESSSKHSRKKDKTSKFKSNDPDSNSSSSRKRRKDKKDESLIFDTNSSKRSSRQSKRKKTTSQSIDECSAFDDGDTSTESLIASAAAANGITASWDRSMNSDDYIKLYVPKAQFRSLFEGNMVNGSGQSSRRGKSPDKKQPRKDRVEKFFDSIAAEVKELPKSVRFQLQSDILELVTSVVQDNP
ncbi:uncharacterized protein LOC144421908 isoform X3 [Styela clava]